VTKGKIGIYVGEGISHSWTWFVDTFERRGYLNLTFPDEEGIKGRALDSLRFLAIGGGDGFAQAYGLGEEGAEKIKDFIQHGGICIGSCAGTYLFLHLEEYPLCLFSLCEATAGNIVEELPSCDALPSKFSTPYGSRYFLHPVREEVELQMSPNLFSPHSRIVAPLYGGPPIEANHDAEVLATYHGFLPDTLFLTDRALAERMMLGKAAILRKKVGRGFIYLFGPHFEEPHFPEANDFLCHIIEHHGGGPETIPDRGTLLPIKDAKSILRPLKRYVSEARIVALGMEGNPVVWTIGRKTYEPEKIRVFLDTVWPRIKVLEREGMLEEEAEIMKELSCRASELVHILLSLRKKLSLEENTLGEAEGMFESLKKFTSLFLESYFKGRSAKS
jgi:hypothetical protein